MQRWILVVALLLLIPLAGCCCTKINPYYGPRPDGTVPTWIGLPAWVLSPTSQEGAAWRAQAAARQAARAAQ